jgi:outer membrane protein OmpA-like peptidoglycan-associated protein
LLHLEARQSHPKVSVEGKKLKLKNKKNHRCLALKSIALGLSLSMSACYPTPGPDKSASGLAIGALLGAGSGAVIGHQVNALGPGAAIGAGFGAVSGLITGLGFDIAEGTELAMQRDLNALKVQVATNGRALQMLQMALDERELRLSATSPSTETIFFDEGRASLRLGTVAQLQRFANNIKINPFVGTIEVHGHSEETGDIEKNIKLSEARARTIATFLGNQGISLDQIQIFHHGSAQPLASNQASIGKLLNGRAEVVLLK